MKKKLIMVAIAVAAICSVGCKKKTTAIDLDMVDIPGMEIKMLSTEVTQKLYESIMGENPSYTIGDNNPVERVSWCDAIYFCNKLSVNNGLTPVYSVDGSTNVKKWKYTPHESNPIKGDIEQNANANGFRLPTADEWEYAAKGGQNYRYSGSNKLDEVGWYENNSGEETHPVAQKKANGYGLYDMSGNVWEWVWDYYINDRRYNYGGSCYDNDDSWCKVDGRCGVSEYARRDDLGFRVVCSASN